MKLKDGASVVGCKWQMFWAAICADKVWQEFGFTGATITSGTDGKHGPNTLHDPALGLGLDFRTWHLSFKAKEAIASRLRQLLGPDYDVVVEDDHIHTEYDPKGVEQ